MDSDQIFSFKVGDFNCISIQDENLTQDVSALFSIVPEDERHLLNFEEGEKFEGSFNCLLIETGDKRILIDTGNGVETDGDGRLFQHLATLNIKPDSIDIVVLTHAHADHYAGMLTGNGDKCFPNAKYIMWRDEWEFYSSVEQLKLEKERDESGARYDFIAKWFLPLEKHLTLIDEESAEFYPGIKAFYNPGHTRHHIVIEVKSNDEQLLVLGDAFVHPLQVTHTQWHFPFELNADQLKQSRAELIEYASASQALTHTYHFPFPGLGTIKKSGDSAIWEASSG